MKTLRRLAVPAVFLLALCSSNAAHSQITPSGDAYTNTATPTTNLGTKPTLGVESGSQTTYIQFDLPFVAKITRAARDSGITNLAHR